MKYLTTLFLITLAIGCAPVTDDDKDKENDSYNLGYDEAVLDMKAAYNGFVSPGEAEALHDEIDALYEQIETVTVEQTNTSLMTDSYKFELIRCQDREQVEKLKVENLTNQLNDFKQLYAFSVTDPRFANACANKQLPALICEMAE